jgi:outer membrane murein-binding lipoprotein Lpp
MANIGWSYEDPKTVGKLLTGILAVNVVLGFLLLAGLLVLNRHVAAVERHSRQMSASLQDLKSDVSSLQEDVEDMAAILDEASQQ